MADFSSGIRLLWEGMRVALLGLMLKAAGQAWHLGPCPAWSLLLAPGSPTGHL